MRKVKFNYRVNKPRRFPQLYFPRKPTSKKDMAEIGLSCNRCDESRSFSAEPAASSFLLPVFGGSDGGASAPPVLRKRFPVDQPVRAAAPDWSRVRRFLQTELFGGHSWLTLPHIRLWHSTAHLFSPFPAKAVPHERQPEP